jgi:hypothetical protein
MSHYVIRVAGQLPDDALDDFDWLVLTRQPPTAIVRGDVTDQAALAELLTRLARAGAVIRDVVRTPAPGDGAESADGAECP